MCLIAVQFGPCTHPVDIGTMFSFYRAFIGRIVPDSGGYDNFNWTYGSWLNVKSFTKNLPITEEVNVSFITEAKRINCIA